MTIFHLPPCHPHFCDILPTSFLLSQCRLVELVFRFPWDNVLYQGILREREYHRQSFGGPRYYRDFARWVPLKGLG